MESTYFRRGFGLKAEIEGQLTADYHSAVVEVLRARQYRLDVGRLSFRLAREFGFCYGVDRAVDYAYETRVKFPDRRLFLVGEIIHNPHVNQKLRTMGVEFLVRSEDGAFDFGSIGADDVVILPAFGVTMGDFERLRTIGCVLVRVGIANQTTMLAGESLAIAEEFRDSMERRYGSAAIPDHFRSFDTICSATQERQDAVLALMEEPLDVMLVVGGYNSSNTCHLAALVQQYGIRTYHIEDADAVDVVSGAIRHQPIGTKSESVT